MVIKIERELIFKAYETLGDKIPELIVSLLGIKDYNAQSMKALCPFHAEDTPSFCYDRKRHRFYCFGCRTSCDLITAYMMGERLTFLQAVEKVFALAEIKYSFGEMGLKLRRQYRYPAAENPDNDMTPVYDYLALRGISKKTVDMMDVGADAQGNIVFYFYDTNDTLTTVKYRPSHKVEKGRDKTWAQKGADTTPTLFNMERTNPNEPLLICEGEIDCMAAYEAGYKNVVSVPFGAGNFHWIDENWDYLEGFSTIILCGDNDEAGKKMNKEASSRLGTWRTKIVQLPSALDVGNGQTRCISDVNELLVRAGKEEVMRCILDAEQVPVDSVVDYSGVASMNVAEIDGVETGIKELDEQLMRFFNGTVTVLTGITGSGKSSLISQWLAECVDSGKSAWLYSKELPNAMAASWTDRILAGPRHVEQRPGRSGGVYYAVKPESRQAIRAHYKGSLFIYKDDCSSNVEDIMASMEESVRRFGVKLLVIDNMSAISFRCTAEDKYIKQAEFIMELIGFAKRFDVPIIVCLHPHKMDMTRRMDLMDIKGAGENIDLTHRILALYRISPKEREGYQQGRNVIPPNPYSIELTVLKDRMTGKAGTCVSLHYHAPTGRFFSSPQEFSRQYGWDKTQYTDSVPYPVAPPPEEAEVYGQIG